MPRKIVRPVIARAEAPGLFAVAYALRVAVAEHVLVVTWAAQAHMMMPELCGPDLRLNGQHERRILRLSTAIAQATLAFHRLPVVTCDSLILSPPGRGAQAPQNPVTRARLEAVINSPEATEPPQHAPETLTSLEKEDRLFRLRMEPLLGPMRPSTIAESVQRMVTLAGSKPGTTTSESAHRMGGRKRRDAGTTHSESVERMSRSKPQEAGTIRSESVERMTPPDAKPLEIPRFWVIAEPDLAPGFSTPPPSLNQPPAQRRRGGQPGNMNALKKASRSRRSRAAANRISALISRGKALADIAIMLADICRRFVETREATTKATPPVTREAARATLPIVPMERESPELSRNSIGCPLHEVGMVDRAPFGRETGGASTDYALAHPLPPLPHHGYYPRKTYRRGTHHGRRIPPRRRSRDHGAECRRAVGPAHAAWRRPLVAGHAHCRGHPVAGPHARCAPHH
jgi:hypothetical protein